MTILDQCHLTFRWPWLHFQVPPFTQPQTSSSQKKPKKISQCEVKFKGRTKCFSLSHESKCQKMTSWRCLTCWPVKLWRYKMTSLVNKSGHWTPNYHKILIFSPPKSLKSLRAARIDELADSNEPAMNKRSGGSKIPCRRVRQPSRECQHTILLNFPKRRMKSRKVWFMGPLPGPRSGWPPPSPDPLMKSKTVMCMLK